MDLKDPQDTGRFYSMSISVHFLKECLRFGVNYTVSTNLDIHKGGLISWWKRGWNTFIKIQGVRKRCIYSNNFGDHLTVISWPLSTIHILNTYIKIVNSVSANACFSVLKSLYLIYWMYVYFLGGHSVRQCFMSEPLFKRILPWKLCWGWGPEGTWTSCLGKENFGFSSVLHETHFECVPGGMAAYVKSARYKLPCKAMKYLITEPAG